MGFIDPNDFESVALDTASEMGGAYLTAEKTKIIIDNKAVMVPLYTVAMEYWTPEQWKTLIGTICAGYVQSLIDQADQANKALAKVQSVPPAGAGEFPSFNLNNDLPN